MFGQPAIDNQRREAVDEGPACEGNIVPIRIALEEFRRLDGLPKGVKTSAARFVQDRMSGFFLDRRAEHQLEEARLVACEKNVGDTERGQPRSGIGRRRCRCGKPGCKLAEAVFGDCRKQRFLVREMTIGAIADTRARRAAARSESPATPASDRISSAERTSAWRRSP